MLEESVGGAAGPLVPVAGLPVQEATPWALAVKDASAPAARQLAAALRQLAAGGPADAPLARYEAEALGAAGTPPNADLAALLANPDAPGEAPRLACLPACLPERAEWAFAGLSSVRVHVGGAVWQGRDQTHATSPAPPLIARPAEPGHGGRSCRRSHACHARQAAQRCQLRSSLCRHPGCGAAGGCAAGVSPPSAPWQSPQRTRREGAGQRTLPAAEAAGNRSSQ